jgi:Tol biopolymer transport system component/DNA-binding winged helix-turn-helix (wHTH) protein
MDSLGAAKRQVYRFDDIEVDLGKFRVLKSGKPVLLEPKSFNVLVFLIERRGRLVGKRELIDAVWKDAFVTDNVLSRAVAQLRRALGDDAKEARYIETVPTLGYRFIPAITLEATAATGEVTSGAIQSANSFRSVVTSYRRWYVLAAAIITLGALVITFFALRAGSSGDFQILNTVQVTTSTGLAFCPTLSPDGTQIAYATDYGKGFEIFVRQVAPGGKEIQITSDGGQNIQPAWSPNGSLLAYASLSNGGVWVVPALGGTARKLADLGSHPAWSGDGQWIAFQSGGIDDISADSSGILPPSTIWIVRPDGTGARPVTLPGRPLGAHGLPSWSRDSKHIVFVSEFSGVVWVVSPDGSGLVQLTDGSFRSYDPVYSPDGKSVFFGAAVRAGEDVQVFGLSRVRVSPRTSAPIAKPEQLMNSSGTHIKSLAFSADGKKLIYAALALRSSLQVLRLSKSMEPAGEPAPLTSTFGCRTTLPSFSPDGSHIAFASCLGKTGEGPQIWLIAADGKDPQQLTFQPELATYSTWYPDSRHLLIGSDRQRKLISLDIETRQEKVVGEFKPDWEKFALSPDGSQLAINVLENGELNIWLVDMASGTLKQLTFDKEKLAFPSWSPDGKYIAAEGQRGTDNDVVILPAAGGRPEQLTPYRRKQWVQGWSSDSDKVLFAKQDDDLSWNIWTVSRSTKEQKELTHYTGPDSYVRYPAISARDNSLVYEKTETNGNVWMLELK